MPWRHLGDGRACGLTSPRELYPVQGASPSSQVAETAAMDGLAELHGGEDLLSGRSLEVHEAVLEVLGGQGADRGGDRIDPAGTA